MVEVEGLASRVTPFPVAASKYSSLCPVAGGGVVWLRWPISGALGETFANPADTSDRPTLEHFDIVRGRAPNSSATSTRSPPAATAPGWWCWTRARCAPCPPASRATRTPRSGSTCAASCTRSTRPPSGARRTRRPGG
ncbi:hypothetical protein ACFQVA_25620 [Actinomadura keratinilytica]